MMMSSTSMVSHCLSGPAPTTMALEHHRLLGGRQSRVLGLLPALSCLVLRLCSILRLLVNSWLRHRVRRLLATVGVVLSRLLHLDELVDVKFLVVCTLAERAIFK